MPEIRGTIPLDDRPEYQVPCVWCAFPTSTRAETPGRPDLGEVPLHVLCAGAVIVAYRRRNDRNLLGSGLSELERFEGRLSLLAAAKKAGEEVVRELRRVDQLTNVTPEERREIESRIRAFAGEPFAVVDPEGE